MLVRLWKSHRRKYKKKQLNRWQKKPPLLLLVTQRGPIAVTTLSMNKIVLLSFLSPHRLPWTSLRTWQGRNEAALLPSGPMKPRLCQLPNKKPKESLRAPALRRLRFPTMLANNSLTPPRLPPSLKRNRKRQREVNHSMRSKMALIIIKAMMKT